ncbi:DUF1707 domain-containing protein [Nocardia sp. 348MFTsu5.1]|uniref:DUF1707 SHOCT-like domain-containing protein n=1 Tax=Nocardia sp. 348MFTsu5.1 TaxID=1172185 RepID=UPI00036728C1|nr:DUF1707 domain-containing protein [Nocardia sp. 348MFTsu5.1]
MSDQTPTGDSESTPETNLSKVRAGDLDRRLAIDILSLAMTQGHLSQAEYDERAEKAMAARTFGELDALTDDLPTPTSKPQSAPATPASPASDVDPDVNVILNRIAVMSGSELKGRSAVGEHLYALALMGGVEIDLRNAIFTSSSLTIRATAIMGGIEIVVPENATVQVNGIGFMGGFGSEADTVGPGVPGAPTITVTGLAFWGGVRVARRPSQDPTPPSLKKN